jgi:capsular polysaccharide biosynthesis protein
LQNRDKGGGALGLAKYGGIARRWLWLVVLLGLTAAGTAAAVSLKVQPLYESTASMTVRPSQAEGQPGYYVTSGQVAKTYAKLLTQRPLLQRVIGELKLQSRPEELERNITVSPDRESTLILVHARDPNPGRATSIANTLVTDFIEEKLDRERQQQLAFSMPLESFMPRSWNSGLARQAALSTSSWPSRRIWTSRPC